MLFALKKILSALLLPPVSSIVLALFGLWLARYHRRTGNTLVVLSLLSVLVLSWPPVSDALVLPPSAGFGYRVVIDLFPTNRVKFDAQAGWPADLKKRESDAEKLAAMIAAQQSPKARAGGRKIIVLDPGHGGLDSGAIGVNGLMEKDLALAEGLKLRRELQALCLL